MVKCLNKLNPNVDIFLYFFFVNADTFAVNREMKVLLQRHIAEEDCLDTSKR